MDWWRPDRCRDLKNGRAFESRSWMRMATATCRRSSTRHHRPGRHAHHLLDADAARPRCAGAKNVPVVYKLRPSSGPESRSGEEQPGPPPKCHRRQPAAGEWRSWAILQPAFPTLRKLGTLSCRPAEPNMVQRQDRARRSVAERAV